MSAPSAAKPSELVRREDDRGVVTLTLTTPQNRNALGLAMIDTLIVAFADIAKDESARVIVLTGEGAALSGGHDLKEIQAHRNDPDRGRAFNEKHHGPLRDAHAGDRRPAEAGDRGGRGRGDGGGLPAGRRLRSGRCGRARALWAFGRQQRALLFVAAGCGRPRGVAQARDGDGADREAL